MRDNVDRLRALGMYAVEPGAAIEVSDGTAQKTGGLGLNDSNLPFLLAAVMADHD